MGAGTTACARPHHRRGAVNVGLLRSWGLWVFFGALGGTLLASAISGAALSIVFGVVALAVALYMAFTPADFKIRDGLPTGIAGAGSGFGIGGLSAMMGIGGGTLCVPYFNAFGFPVHRAVGTAAAIGLIIALPAAAVFIISGWGIAALPQASVGHVNLLGLVLIAPFTTLTAPLGVKLAYRLSPLSLKRALGPVPCRHRDPPAGRAGDFALHGHDHPDRRHAEAGDRAFHTNSARPPHRYPLIRSGRHVMALTIVANIHAAPGQEELVRSELEKLVEPTRKEPGCLQCDLHRDNDDPVHFLFFENRENRDLWLQHMNAPHLAAYLQARDGAVENFTIHEMTKEA